MAEDNLLDDATKTILMSRDSDPKESAKIVFLIGGVLVAGIIYIVAKGAWNKHVTPLYSRISNPRSRKKRKARL